MKKIRILFTIPNFDTAGSGKALLKIAQRLDPERFEPHICCFHDRGKFFQTVKASGIPIHLYQYTADMSSRIKGLKTCWNTSRFFKSLDVDIIHSFHYAADYSEAITAKMAGIKWVYTKKNMNWGRGSSNAWKLRTLLADAVLAQNTDMMNEFFPGSTKVSLVPRGVDTDEFKPSEKAQYLLDEFDLPTSARIVLCVANLVPVKGVEYLIEAFASLPPSENDYLFIVGDNQNDYAQRLLDQANSYKMQQRIVFTGKRLDVKAFHSIAHTFVLPTLNEGRQEGSPVSLLEAMAAGTHVLASDVAGIRDQLARCPDQLFIPGDAKEIARKIAESLQMDASMYASSIQQQLDIVQSTYTIQKEVLRHEQVYSKLQNC